LNKQQQQQQQLQQQQPPQGAWINPGMCSWVKWYEDQPLF
jgi:hypothetical protein